MTLIENKNYINNMNKECFYLYEDKGDVTYIINDFCKNLEKYNDDNDDTDIKFQKLPLYIQCIFTNIVKYIPEKDRNLKINNLIVFISDREKSSEKSREKSREKTKTRTRTRTKVIYEKEGQKRPNVDTLDPLFLFYSSLYQENIRSKMAITWLVEHGCFENEEREKLLEQYYDITQS